MQTWSTHSISLAHDRRVRVESSENCGHRNVQHLSSERGAATVYQDSWDRDAAIAYREQLPCTREPGNSKDPFAVAVVRSRVTVSQQLRTINRVCTTLRAALAAAASDWVWLTRILNPRKLFLQNFVKGQSAKILSLENLALYGIPDCIKNTYNSWWTLHLL